MDGHPVMGRTGTASFERGAVSESTLGLGRDTLAARAIRGLLANEFELAFQGIYHAATGALHSVEALVRWIHPEYGLLVPSTFFAAMENPIVARELTDFVIARACEHLGERQRTRRAVCPIAINVPPSVAAAPNFTAQLKRVLDQYGADPAWLEIELSETEDATQLLATPAQTRALRQTGVKLALDDFGTGYSSLAALSMMDFDTVKIARELIAAVPESPRACAVMSGVLKLLEQMNVTVVVEGVETNAQARWLAQWPGVLVQGFLWGKPRFGLNGLASHPEGHPAPTGYASLSPNAQVRTADAVRARAR
jgi:EAL domain-containing protein (putative c-di-GMP-specific phosphodiesterase class I)